LRANIGLTRGVAHRKRGDYDAAIADFNKTIEPNPDLARAYFQRGLAYWSKRQFVRALADFAKGGRK
jgi:tetratricopeptide (TPR) repeat protein